MRLFWPPRLNAHVLHLAHVTVLGWWVQSAIKLTVKEASVVAAAASQPPLLSVFLHNGVT